MTSLASLIPSGMQARPYQLQDGGGILAQLQRGAKAPLYVLPTGGGKGFVIGLIVRALLSNEPIWLFIHRDRLVEQLSETLRDFGIHHGIVAAGYPETDALVQVASIQTVAARIEQLKPRLRKVRYGLVDEAHHAVAPQWMMVRAAMEIAQIIGLTATPYRLDGQGLGAVFDCAVEGPTKKELISGGYLAPAKVFAPAIPLDIAGTRKAHGDFIKSDAAKLVNTDAMMRLAIRSYARWCPGESCLPFSPTVEHTIALAEAFRAEGWLAETITGETPKPERRALFEALRHGRAQILGSCEMVSEGADVRGVGAVMGLRLTESTMLFLQQVGRAQRPDTDSAIYIDLVGNTARHGHPDEYRQWSLDGGLKGKERLVEATCRCRFCCAVFTVADTCPNCLAPQPKRLAGAPTSAMVANMAAVGGIPADRVDAMKPADAFKLVKTAADVAALAQIKGFDRAWVARNTKRLVEGNSPVAARPDAPSHELSPTGGVRHFTDEQLARMGRQRAGGRR